MFNFLTGAGGKAARRTVPSLALAAGLLLSTFGGPSPTSAQGPTDLGAPDVGTTAARIQVAIDNVKIINDRDWGDGEFFFGMWLMCYTVADERCPEHGNGVVNSFRTGFSAGAGETRTLDLVLPTSLSRIPFGPKRPEADALAKTGYALRSDRTYRLNFAMSEEDDLRLDQQMGVKAIQLTYDNGWGVGTHTGPSTRLDSTDPGDFEITFEVRPMPFPDLHPASIKVQDQPGSARERICTSVQNLAGVDAGPFEVALSVDGVVPAEGRVTAPGLGAGKSSDLCFETQLLIGGARKLEVLVDGADALMEFNESNNRVQQTHAPTQVTSTPVPGESTTRAAQADLSLSAMRVNGQPLDGKDDCKDGKNAMSVVVKNTGLADASGFAVRLVIDGADGNALEQMVPELATGQEREVRFSDVELKKGEHKIVATLDPKNSVAEANEGNNALTATARCKG